MTPYYGMALVVLLLATMLLLLREFQKRYAPHPESVRKLLHVGMGVVTLFFPWMFSATWPVWILAALAVGFFLALPRVKILSDQFGAVLNSVKRDSRGDIYFPMSVAVLFQVATSTGRPEFYLVAVMVMSFADAAAAWIGSRYGTHRYKTLDGEKSIEGSCTFFIVAFLCVYIPLLLMTSTAREDTLLLALVAAYLLTLVEAVSWRGLDNLLVPFSAYLILYTALDMNVSEFKWSLWVLMGLSMATLWLRKFTRFDTSAMLTIILVCYFSLILGGRDWLWAPLSVLLAWGLLTYFLGQVNPVGNGRTSKATAEKENAPRVTDTHSVVAVISVAATGLILAALNKAWPNAGLFYVYTLAYTGQLSLITLVYLKFHYRSLGNLGLVCFGVGVAILCVLTPYILFFGGSFEPVWNFVWGVVIIVSASSVFLYWQMKLKDGSSEFLRWLPHASIGLVVGLAGLGVGL